MSTLVMDWEEHGPQFDEACCWIFHETQGSYVHPCGVGRLMLYRTQNSTRVVVVGSEPKHGYNSDLSNNNHDQEKQIKKPLS